VQEIKGSPVLDPAITNYFVQAPRDQSYVDATGIHPIADGVLAPLSSIPDSYLTHNKGFLDRDGNKFNNLTLDVTWSHSTLNNNLFPTAGDAQSLSFEFTIPGSDLNYYRVRYFNEKYFQIYGEWVLHARADLGYGDGYGKTEQLPFFQNFYAGVMGTVRGFKRNTLGPRSTAPEQYNIQSSVYQRDSDGNILLDTNGKPVVDTPYILGADGLPVIDPNTLSTTLNKALYGYVLQAATDADGNVVKDANGQTVYLPKLDHQVLYSGTPAPFGGNIQTTGTIELLFPLPFVPDRSRVRSAFFIDAGNVFSSYCSSSQMAQNTCMKFDLKQLRYSAGLSVAWQSGALGIMSFSLAKAFNTSTIDQREVFQFNLGNTF